MIQTKPLIKLNRSGYTLIELLLYVAIASIILGGMSMFFILTAEARAKNQTIQEVEQQGQTAMSYMGQLVRGADVISVPAAAASGAQLTLAYTDPINLNPSVVNLSGTTLQTKEGAAVAVALTNTKVQVTNLTFRNLSRSGTPGTVQISLTLSRINTLGRTEYDYQKTFVTTATVRQ